MVWCPHYVRECPDSETLENIAFLLLHDPELDHQVLHEHADCILILIDKRNDDISMFHRRFNKVLVSGFDKSVILDEHILNLPASLRDIALDYRVRAKVNLLLRARRISSGVNTKILRSIKRLNRSS